MNKLVCNYATVRFLPYRETGEFVNVGVVVCCPEVDFLDFRIPKRRSRRVTEFFPELDQNVFQSAIETLNRELRTYRNAGSLFTEGRAVSATEARKALSTFGALMRRRESLLHFAEVGVRMVDDPRSAVDELFEHFVNRSFAHQPEYQERVMQRRLTTWLGQWNLRARYRTNWRVGDDTFHITMPFVHLQNDVPATAIKPFDLNKPEPTAIYDHGDTWVQRMRRLRDRRQMPPKVVFAVRLPQQDHKREAASGEIVAALSDLSINVVNFDDAPRLRQLVEL